MTSTNLISESLAAQSYDAWADLRRREIIADMAVLQKERLMRQQVASRALGRHNALEKLRDS